MKTRKKTSQRSRTPRSQNTVLARMLTERPVLLFYLYLRTQIETADTYIRWLERSMRTMGNIAPASFFKNCSVESLDSQIEQLKHAVTELCPKESYRRNMVCAFKRYVNWYKANSNGGKLLQAA